MSQFLFLPDSQSILNLDHVEAVFAAEEFEADEVAIEVLTNGDPDSTTYVGEDAKTILAAVAGHLGISGDELAAKMKPEEDV